MIFVVSCFKTHLIKIILVRIHHDTFFFQYYSRLSYDVFVMIEILPSSMTKKKREKNGIVVRAENVKTGEFWESWR